ncbi:MAG: DUF2007 domain-containing protein [Thermoanaerobaculia bacterium]
MSDWKVVETVGTEEEATLVAGFLEAEGIPSRIESLLFHQEPTNFGALSEVRIHVPETELERARAILESRETSTSGLGEGELGGEEPDA